MRLTGNIAGVGSRSQYEPRSVPRQAFTYWHQGISQAPPIVRTCVARIKSLNPDWDIYVLDRDSIAEIFEPPPVSSEKLELLNLPHRSDLIRTKLLIDYGGVWIDPTVFSTQPLDMWLHSKMQAGLFLYSRPGHDRLISNWFIASQPGHPILRALYDSLCEYWCNNNFRSYSRKPTGWAALLVRLINRNLYLPRVWFSWPFRKIVRVVPYMVFHYMFYDLLCKRPDLRELYSKMPTISAEGPCALQWLGLESSFDAAARRILYDNDLPLHKLTWQTKQSAVLENSILEHLLYSQG